MLVCLESLISPSKTLSVGWGIHIEIAKIRDDRWIVPVQTFISPSKTKNKQITKLAPTLIKYSVKFILMVRPECQTESFIDLKV